MRYRMPPMTPRKNPMRNQPHDGSPHGVLPLN
jgi:hypothetical protein